VRFADLTYEEIRQRTEAGGLAIVPLGCTEQQGPHLPVDFDTWFAETLTLAAAERAQERYGIHALVLPALPFGPTPEHRGYGAGYIDLPSPLHQAVVSAIVSSLVAQRFRQIVLWRGCGGHDMRQVVDELNRVHQGRARVYLPEPPFHAIWCRLGDPRVPGGHADSFTTSVMLYLRPEAVRADRIVNPCHPPIDWTLPNLDLSRYSPTGVVGDPTHASAELGEKLWDAAVDAVAEVLRGIWLGT
jgi:creatinine amidohydrolase